uniref:Uncharacterized protein n=1 Tax=Cucumis sativus TaxID=3659 RepID=A0A0A0K689_CUCSA
MNVEELVEGHDGYCFEILRVKKWNCENLRLKKLKFGSSTWRNLSPFPPLVGDSCPIQVGSSRGPSGHMYPHHVHKHCTTGDPQVVLGIFARKHLHTNGWQYGRARTTIFTGPLWLLL